MHVLANARSLIHASSNIVSFSGAGLSAESGLATFRDAHGIWSQYDPAIYASIDGFERDPRRVTEWYQHRRRSYASATPNAAHRALASKSMVHVTQNIDTLLERAGAQQVIHLHGVLDRDRCHARCGHAETIDTSEPPGVRECPRCGAMMRPDVVWFGEQLPDRAWKAAEAAIAEADILLVVGTSAEVWPAAGIIQTAHQRGTPIVIVNAERTAASRMATVELIGRAGELVPALLAVQNPSGSSME